MGHLKLAPPFNVVVSPRPARAQAQTQTTPRRKPAEDDALAALAQRFAPNACAPGAVAPRTAAPDAVAPRAPASPAPDLPQDTPPSGPVGAFKALPHALQGLILALVLIALLPSLTLTALVWFGPDEGSGLAKSGKTPHLKTPQIKTASLVDLPFGARESAGSAPDAAPDTLAAAETPESGQASLAAPHRLEAEAGGDVPFAIALASVAPLPPRSVIAVSGLPSGATLSAGRPYADTEWNLRTDELSGLRLSLPATAQGETTLAVALIAADGETLAEAETALKVTAPAQATDTAETAPAPETAPSALGPGFDPLAAPPIATVATLQVPQGLAPEAQVPQASETQAPQAQESVPPAPQVSETDPVEAAAPEDAPADAEAIEADAADSSEESASALADTASETAVAPGSGNATSGNATSGPFANNAAEAESSLALSDFVNLRARPSSSSRVIAVMAKGTKVTPKAKRRGWLKVTDAASGKTGWIYGRYAGGTATASSGGTPRPSRLGAGTSSGDESWLVRFGDWLIN